MSLSLHRCKYRCVFKHWFELCCEFNRKSLKTSALKSSFPSSRSYINVCSWTANVTTGVTRVFKSLAYVKILKTSLQWLACGRLSVFVYVCLFLLSVFTSLFSWLFFFFLLLPSIPCLSCRTRGPCSLRTSGIWCGPSSSSCSDRKLSPSNSGSTCSRKWCCFALSVSYTAAADVSGSSCFISSFSCRCSSTGVVIVLQCFHRSCRSFKTLKASESIEHNSEILEVKIQFTSSTGILIMSHNVVTTWSGLKYCEMLLGAPVESTRPYDISCFNPKKDILFVMSWRTVWPTILNLNNDWLVQVAVTMEMFKPVHVGSLSERKTSETARAVISREWSSAAYRSEAIFTAHTTIMKRNKLKKAGSRSLWNLGFVVLYVMSCSFTVKSKYAHGFVQFFFPNHIFNGHDANRSRLVCSNFKNLLFRIFQKVSGESKWGNSLLHTEPLRKWAVTVVALCSPKTNVLISVF